MDKRIGAIDATLARDASDRGTRFRLWAQHQDLGRCRTACEISARRGCINSKKTERKKETGQETAPLGALGENKNKTVACFVYA